MSGPPPSSRWQRRAEKRIQQKEQKKASSSPFLGQYAVLAVEAESIEELLSHFNPPTKSSLPTIVLHAATAIQDAYNKKKMTSPPIPPSQSQQQWRAKPTQTPPALIPLPDKTPTVKDYISASLKEQKNRARKLFFDMGYEGEAIVYPLVDEPDSKLEKIAGVGARKECTSSSDENLRDLSVEHMLKKEEQLLTYYFDEDTSPSTATDTQGCMFLPGSNSLKRQDQWRLLWKCKEQGIKWRHCLKTTENKKELKGTHTFVNNLGEEHNTELRAFDFTDDQLQTLTDLLNTLTEEGLFLLLMCFRMTCAHSVECYLRILHRSLGCSKDNGADTHGCGPFTRDEHGQLHAKCVLETSSRLVYDGTSEVSMLTSACMKSREMMGSIPVEDRFKWWPANLVSALVTFTRERLLNLDIHDDIMNMVKEEGWATGKMDTALSEKQELKWDTSVMEKLRVIFHEHGSGAPDYANFILTNRMMTQFSRGLLFAAEQIKILRSESQEVPILPLFSDDYQRTLMETLKTKIKEGKYGNIGTVPYVEEIEKTKPIETRNFVDTDWISTAPSETVFSLLENKCMLHICDHCRQSRSRTCSMKD